MSISRSSSYSMPTKSVKAREFSSNSILVSPLLEVACFRTRFELGLSSEDVGVMMAFPCRRLQALFPLSLYLSALTELLALFSIASPTTVVCLPPLETADTPLGREKFPGEDESGERRSTESISLGLLYINPGASKSVLRSSVAFISVCLDVLFPWMESDSLRVARFCMRS